MVSGLNYSPYGNYVQTLMQNPAMRNVVNYGVMNYSKPAADYLAGADQCEQEEKLGDTLLYGGAFMASPWIYKAGRHPIGMYKALKPTNDFFKGLNVKGVPTEQLHKALAEVYNTERLLKSRRIVGLQNSEVRKAIRVARENLKVALNSGNATEIAKYTGELQGLTHSLKKHTMFFPSWWKSLVKKPTAASAIEASKAAGVAAEKTAKDASAKALSATSIGAKCKNFLRAGGAGMMAILEGVIEIPKIYSTATELGGAAAVRQTGKSALKVGASVGGWLAGAKLGAMGGAALGSLLGPAGTVAGGIIGGVCGLLGGLACSWGARKAVKAVVGEDELDKAKKQQSTMIAQQLDKDPKKIVEAMQLINQKVEAEGETEMSKNAIAALTEYAEAHPEVLTQLQVAPQKQNAPLTLPDATAPQISNDTTFNFNDPNLYNQLCSMAGMNGLDMYNISGLNNNNFTYPYLNPTYPNLTQSPSQVSPKLDLKV